MSTLPLDPHIAAFAHRAVHRTSLWIIGRPARVLRADGDYAAQILEMDVTGATLVAACVFSLGEAIILTINGAGHVPARVVERPYRGVRVAFDADPALSRTLSRVLAAPAPQVIR